MRNNGTDIRSIASRSRYLLMKAQLAGNLMLDGHGASEEENMIASMCNDMCDLIRRKLPVCRDTEIPQLIECYDMLYRVANHKLPDAAMITGYTRRLLNAWKSGNKEIEESMVYGLISSSTRLYPERTDNATKNAGKTILLGWISTLKKFGYFPDVSSYENYQRLALLMQENLDEYFNGDAGDARFGWYVRNKIEDITTLGSLLLESYRRFISTLFQEIDFEEKTALELAILRELSGRPDLAPQDREAYRLALRFTQQSLSL
ncbi:MAG: hypothetical protein K2G52_12325 [Muribaculaceae bacterium]|nr:hypothetical protein [Muribaculaceae bacterium]